MDCLDVVEKSEGAACLVTIGTNPKMFSSGFDVKNPKSTVNT